MSKRATTEAPERLYAHVEIAALPVEFDATPECYFTIAGYTLGTWEVLYVRDRPDCTTHITGRYLDAAWHKLAKKYGEGGGTIVKSDWLVLTDKEAIAFWAAWREYERLKSQALIAKLEEYTARLREEYGE